MPSAEMRRNTRIFGARVLRSGRRVSTGSTKVKHMKTKNVAEWIDLLDDSGDDVDDAPRSKKKGWRENGVPQQEVTAMDTDKKLDPILEEDVHENLNVDRDIARMFGIVYTRKRKKLNSDVSCSLVYGEKATSVDKRFQKYFVRKRWKKKIRLSETDNICDSTLSLVTREMRRNTCLQAIVIVVRPWCSNKYFVTGILASALRYMRKARIELDQLACFFFSKTVCDVCSSCGIHFMQDTGSLPKRGFCIISGSHFIPLVYVDFSAVPSCFMYLHSCMQLRYASMGPTFRGDTSSAGKEEKDDRITATCLHVEKDQVAGLAVGSVIDLTEPELVPPLDVCPAMFVGRTVQLRSTRVNKSHSLRSRRGRPPSAFRARKPNGALASNSPNFRRDSIQLSPRPLYLDRGSVAQKNTCSSVQQVKPDVLGYRRAVNLESCVANILVMESDRCYREEGVVITLEVSAGRRWHLAIKKNGVLQYSFIAQKFMRPCTCNHFTRASIWSIENGWKLEFTDKLEWSAFKELYKQCLDRNGQVPLESIIPIPGVHEVPVYLNDNSYFVRPGSYINVKDDELTRALARKTANYDMESDDEEWVNKFNEDNVTDAVHKLLSFVDFELIIDAFERGFHCNPDDYSDERAAPKISLNVIPRVVEAVYGYWIKKRKQKRSALVRVFQLYRPRRSQFIPKSVLRKKRSLKRQRVQSRRGKQPAILQAMAAEQEAQEHRDAVLRVEETKAAAKRSEVVAILKRQRAQQLMENADMVTYKAVMAIRIAELARIAESADAVGRSSR